MSTHALILTSALVSLAQSLVFWICIRNYVDPGLTERSFCFTVLVLGCSQLVKREVRVDEKDCKLKIKVALIQLFSPNSKSEDFWCLNFWYLPIQSTVKGAIVSSFKFEMITSLHRRYTDLHKSKL